MDDENETLDGDIYTDEDDEKRLEKYLIFELGGENYGIDITYVTEIIGIQDITFMPDVPEYVKGVLNLRGRIIPLIDLRLRFGLPEKEYNDRTCIIVVSDNEITLGIIVDLVKEVMNIPQDAISPSIDIGGAESKHFVQGLGIVSEEVKILIDVAKLLSDDEMLHMRTAAEESKMSA